MLKAISDHKEQSLKQYLVAYSDEQKTTLLTTLREILGQTGNKPPGK